MKPVAPMDALFLIGESREHPQHVAGLQVFTRPAGAGQDFLPQLYREMLDCTDVQPAFRKHPARMLGGASDVAWKYDEELDLEYHIRRSGLPAPGRARELLELTSRLHGSLLDRHRPLWETHLIESSTEDRFALYTKVHHAVVDGVSALKLMERSLTADPGDDVVRVPWALPPRPRRPAGERPKLMDRLSRSAGNLGMFGPSNVASTRAALREQQLTLPFRAPRTMLNVPIGGARRCAAQSWSLQRVKAVKNAAGVSVNDVVLAMCGGALRSYLGEQGALPETPLIAMVPVNVRSQNNAVGGNAISTVLCNLATHLQDPAKRLDVVHTSMEENKKVLAQMPRAQAMSLGMLILTTMWLSGRPGFRAGPPPFNLCVSNIPGSPEPLYWKGARLEASYPLSVVMDGQALNITLVSNADNLNFGLVGCRRNVPHLQRLLGHLEAALADLEQAVGL